MPFVFAPVALNMAPAQMGQPKTPYTVKIGYAYLSDKSSRDATSTSGYSVGLSYNLGKLAKDAPGTFAVDLDFTKHSGNGNKLENWALMGVYRAPFASQLYYGVGLGLSNTLVSQGVGTTSAFLTREVQGSGGGGGVGAGSISERKTVFGGVILVGSKVSENGSLELYYRFQSSVSGVNANVLGLTYGVHF